MKCPLQIIAGLHSGDTLNPALMDCLKEECAWWHEGLEECCLRVLTDDISTINGTLLNQSVNSRRKPWHFNSLSW
jgi:hypothetical protein